ncbi:hypothetical protein HK100_007010 [Physocladia obscura]|uniref:UBA domain-containing protein n=1 Tax=Physocladia obscura TaxID=109957 RepID=A0AAD5SS50_9FUNG|nr:hypothetical protein HK100_007010 [Physocladia obscura]
MIASGPSGFYNAPVTKFLFASSGLATLAGAMYGSGRGGGPLSIVGAVFGLGSASAALFGSLVVYGLRVVERRLGSRKTAAHVAVAFGAYALVPAWAWVAGSGANGGFGFAVLAPVFALLVAYGALVPPTLRVRVVGVTVSDAALLPLLAALLVLAAAPRALVPAAIGLAVGVVLRDDDADLPFARWRFPDALVALVAKLFLPLLASRSPVSASSSSASSFANRLQPQPQQQQHQQQRPRPPPVISEDSVNTLVAMGFERSAVVTALTSNGGSVERAAASLVS